MPALGRFHSRVPGTVLLTSSTVHPATWLAWIPATPGSSFWCCLKPRGRSRKGWADMDAMKIDRWNTCCTCSAEYSEREQCTVSREHRHRRAGRLPSLSGRGLQSVCEVHTYPVNTLRRRSLCHLTDLDQEACKTYRLWPRRVSS